MQANQQQEMLQRNWEAERTNSQRQAAELTGLQANLEEARAELASTAADLQIAQAQHQAVQQQGDASLQDCHRLQVCNCFWHKMDGAVNGEPGLYTITVNGSLMHLEHQKPVPL